MLRLVCFSPLKRYTNCVSSNGYPIHVNRRHEMQKVIPTAHSSIQQRYDVVVVGGGHNGLTAAAYLARAGKSVLVAEKRNVIGGAAVTEELIPGYLFSRGSYLLSLLRPAVIRDLNLQSHGLKYFFRNPSSFTPMLDGRSLTLGNDADENWRQIAKFSVEDADNYPKYEGLLSRLASAIDPLLDHSPPDFETASSLRGRLDAARSFLPLLTSTAKIGRDLPAFYEILTSPASKILRSWFKSEPLISTLATDSIIGNMCSPETPGSGYVLFHHVMGGIEGKTGSWAYVKGGMGSVSNSLALAAKSYGAHIAVDANVTSIEQHNNGGQVSGIRLEDGTVIEADIVISNSTPFNTFRNLIGESAQLPKSLQRQIEVTNYESPVCKINVALSALPNFAYCCPTIGDKPGPHHQTTIHFVENSAQLNEAYAEAVAGRESSRPVVEMCLPSVLDNSVAPPGCHVASLFTQYAPYHLESGTWNDEGRRERWADRVFSIIEQHCPGFTESIVGVDILSPPDLERVFGLTGGNIFHGSMSLDQLYFSRPTRALANYRTPIQGLYLTGAGTHPGGGVMGASGRNTASVILKDVYKKGY